jgi:hypothetical protein
MSCESVDSLIEAYETLATAAPEPVVMWDQSYRGVGPGGSVAWGRVQIYLRFRRYLCGVAAIFLMLSAAVTPSYGRKKNTIHYGAGLIVNIPLPEPEVAQAVEDVAQNTLIRGTKEYNKDQYVSGAVAMASTPVFAKWTGTGRVFYKVRLSALDPRNFKDGGDVGTLAVRYVVQPQGDNNTVLRIDALFEEDFRRTVHASDGTVESSEYKDIQDHLAAVELIKKETADALLAKEHPSTTEKFSSSKDQKDQKDADATSAPPVEAQPKETASDDGGADARKADTADGTTSPEATLQASARTAPVERVPPPAYELQPGESLEHHVAELKKQVERLIKKPGAPLQSAPFHTATSLKSLEPGTEVLILITTPYWYGVETRDGDHGWIRRDQLEQLP